MKFHLPGVASIVAATLIAFSANAEAQQTTISGTVTDSTGAVLPGVTVVAVHEASGNSFETVTDEHGTYRIPTRTGVFQMSAQLTGFTTVTRTGLELLVGQQGVVNFQLSPSTVQETITVTGEAPLVDTSSSAIAGNIDPRQVSELPVNGRNWMDLTLLAPGSRLNAVAEVPVAGGTGAFQLNLDGQQVTQFMSYGFGQPRFSRDAIAEFEFIGNRFDATQGRSSGVQINAVTKSGTNVPTGSASGYFRSDQFNAADLVTHRVLPYSNQQLSGTFGGPIRRDHIHFFLNYEYEREPQTYNYSTPYPQFNLDLTATREEHKGGVRLDFQFSPKNRLTVRGSTFGGLIPYDPRYTGGATKHPSSAVSVDRYSNDLSLALTQVLGTRAVNEIKAGYAGYNWNQQAVVSWPNHPQAAAGMVNGTPIITLRGLTIGQGHTNTPTNNGQEPMSFRDDFSYSFTKGGRHDVKAGGEYIRMFSWIKFCNRCMGILDAQGGAIPANIETLFPTWNDVSSWNLAALSPISRSFEIGVGNFVMTTLRHEYAAWLQDDWSLTQRLTLNLGVRYDLLDGAFAESIALPPFLNAGRPNDKNNVAPRLGAAYSVNDRTVLRGGFGKYFSEVPTTSSLWTVAWSQQSSPDHSQ